MSCGVVECAVQYIGMYSTTYGVEQPAIVRTNRAYEGHYC